ncbi:MAG: thermonuclease family protein [Thermoguttaceae bacterium]
MEQNPNAKPGGFLIGLVIGAVIYFLFIASSDPGIFRGNSQPDVPKNEQSTANYKAEELCRVERVVDGDTIVVVSDGASVRVRLIGVDTPETAKPKTDPQPFGVEATAYTTNRIAAFNNMVVLRSDGDLVDRYGRRLSLVYLGRDGTDLLNEELIRRGLGVYEPQYNYSKSMKLRFQNAENEAKSERIGIWSLPESTDKEK